jgi:uncharacterized protein DUF4157
VIMRMHAQQTKSASALASHATQAARATTARQKSLPLLLQLQRSYGNQFMQRTLRTMVQPRLAVSRSDDRCEQEADRVAARIVGGAPGSMKHGQPPFNPQLSSGPENATPETAPASVQRAVADPGSPMESGLRQEMEQRFGQDFSQVRVHNGAAADHSAQDLRANAYTVGPNVVFGAGQFAPATDRGRRLIAHELAHVVQQQHVPSGRAPVVQRQSWSEQLGTWYDDKKWAVYRGMIAALKGGRQQTIAFLRSKVPALPDWAHGTALGLIDGLDVTIDMLGALCLAIIGLAVGFVEGIVGLIVGLIKLAYGLIKMFVDAILSPLDKGEAVKADYEFLATAVKNFVPAMNKLIADWWERYKKASPEEQVLMGGELIGQIEAFIATFLVAGTKAGQAGKIAIPTGLKVETKIAVVGVTATGEAIGIKVPSAVAVTSTAVAAKPIAQGLTVAAKATALGSGGGGGGGRAGGPKFSEASEAEIDKAVEGIKADGDLVELGPHGAASRNRRVLGVSGKDVQSAHFVPQAVGRKLAGYNPDHALTRLMGRADHASMDLYWKQQFQAMRAAGRTDAVAEEYFDIISESINRAPNISAGEKSSYIAHLKDELFMQLGLKPTELIELPYPNIKPP